MNTSSETGERRARIARLEALQGAARGRLRLAGLCTVLSGMLLVVQAGAIAWAIQHALVEGAPPARLSTALGVLLLTGVLRALLAWRARTLADAAVEDIRQSFRAQLVRRLFGLGPLALRQRRSGEVAELMGTHVDALEGYFGGYLLARVEVMVVPLALLVAVFCVDRVVGLILLLTLPLIPLFMMLVGLGAEAASQRQLQALARMGGHFADRLRGLGVIRLYGRGEAELAEIATAAEGVRAGSLKVLRIAFLSSAVLEFFASLGVAMVAVYLGLSYLGMIDLRSAPLDLGMGVFCLLLAPEVYAPMRRLATHYHDRASALAALEEVEKALPPADSSHPATVDEASDASPRAASVIRASGLCLRPPGAQEDVLTEVSFALAAGQHLALVGASGCGKSTLLDALAGWLPPTGGRLEQVAGLRIGYAPQRPHLFQGRIADNLRLADPEASDAQVLAAAEAAQVMRFAAHLPQGLQTMIGERGFGLSGGEARRIALARVFLRDPQLLLLDEPTAFLDPETEAALLQSLARFARGRCLVMATHSPAAMRMAGRVLQLPQGVLANAGETP